MAVFHVSLLFNVTPASAAYTPQFSSYRPGHQFASDDRCSLTVAAGAPLAAVYEFCALADDPMSADVDERTWDKHLRGPLPGDIVRVTDARTLDSTFWACSQIRWELVDAPAGPIGGTLEFRGAARTPDRAEQAS